MEKVRKNFTPISKKEFIALFEAIWQKFKEDKSISDLDLFGGKRQPRTQYYPTTAAEEAISPNLKEAMLEVDKVSNYLVKGKPLNGKKLYQYFGDAEKLRSDDQKFLIADQYLKTYCLYVGCENLDDVIVAYVQKRTVFTGLHFSVRYREVRKFEMSIDLSQAPFKATMKGYWHDFPDRTYHGEGMFFKKTGLFFSLTDTETGCFYLIVHIKSLEEMKNSFVMGRALTQSSWDFPISSEVILTNRETSQNNQKMLQIERYFHLKLPTHRTINHDYGGDLDKLIIRKAKPKEFKIQTGYYRTWVYNSEHKVQQQKFQVEENYSASLQRKTKSSEGNGLDTLLCFLALNPTPSKRILLSLYPKGSHSLIGYTLLYNFKPSSEYIYGAYINVGDEDRPPAHHAVILRYEEYPDSFNPEVYDIESEIFKKLLEDPKLLKMKQCLDLLEINDYRGLFKALGT